MKSPLDHARELLEKADNDLVSAQLLAESRQVFDTPCFHAQQTVEKSLKAVLALNDVDYPRTHDLLSLYDLAEPFMPNLKMFYDQIISLMPYAVAIRYSGLEPMPEEVDAAVAISVQIFAMAYKVINPN